MGCELVMQLGTASFETIKHFSSTHISSKHIRFGSTRAERDEAFAKGGQGIPDERYVTTASEQHLQANSYFVTRKKALVWDTPSAQFIYRCENFARQFLKNRCDVTSEELTIPGNTMWDDGVFVDQMNKRLLLPDGRWIDGPTGELYSIHGEPFAKANNTLNKEV